MNEKITSSPSSTGRILTAVAVALILLLIGFLPMGLIGYAFLGWYYEEVFIKILFWIVFLAIIAFATVLIRLAMRSWDNKVITAGIYSVLFGSLAILFVGLSRFYIFRVTIFEESMMVFIIALPALWGFPVIGFVLGLLGFKSQWGKTGLLLALIQLVFSLPDKISG